MRSSAAQATPALALRALYVIVFLAFTALAVGLSAPEWEQAVVLMRPYHFGDDPSPVALIVSLAAVAAAGVLLRGFARGDKASRAVSTVILVCAGTSALRAVTDEPKGRNWAAADKQIVDAASALRERMVHALETEGGVPKSATAWNTALNELKQGSSPARTRVFAAVPYEVVELSSPEGVPATLRPGTLLVWVSPAGDAFHLTPVGFDARGRVARLADASGQPLVLTNALSDFDADDFGVPPSER
jgi:hypothetical protein